VQLLRRVFGEQFAVVAGQPALLSKEKITVVPEQRPRAEAEAHGVILEEVGEPTTPQSDPLPSAEGVASAEAGGTGPLEPGAPVAAAARIQPKGKGQLSSDRVQNPHEPDATYSAKGKGDKKKEHVGYKIQTAETVSQAVLAPGEPTRNFLTGIVTHPAYQSDEAGEEKMD
jgi:hypothetical protein